MGRRSKPRQERATEVAPADWKPERTLAEVEAEEAAEAAATAGASGSDSDTRCACGSRELLLHAFLHVTDGVAKPVPIGVESLTCPSCGREYEAIALDDGRFVRGEFQGWSDVEDDDDD